jgi:hypothetical protein
MVSPNEFWLNLHRLSAAYDAEGTTIKERTANICQQFEQMPCLAQQEVIEELRRLAICLPELYPIIAAAAQTSGQSRLEPARRREDVA